MEKQGYEAVRFRQISSIKPEEKQKELERSTRRQRTKGAPSGQLRTGGQAKRHLDRSRLGNGRVGAAAVRRQEEGEALPPGVGRR